MSAESHAIACVLLILFAGKPSFSPILLIPAVSPIVFARSMFGSRPSYLLLSSASFATIIAINQHS